MTKRTKIERVGGHLLITGCDFINAATGERFTASSSYPVASLIVEEKSTHVTVSAMGVLGFFNVSGWTAREVLEVAYGGGEWLYHPKPTDETRALVDQIDALVEAGTEEIERLRARVAELEEENERLRWVVRASCVRTPTPGCDCPGCETAREREAQVDLVESYEAELEEDRQAERDRILGARVREVLEANGTNPERFVSEWCRAQAEYETEESAR